MELRQIQQKSFEKRRNLPGEGTCKKLSKIVGCLGGLMAKGGRQPPYIIQSNCRSKNYSVSTFKFRFILPNLHKMNWRDLVTFCIVNLRKISSFFMLLTISTLSTFHMSKKSKCEIEAASKWCLLSDSCKESPKKVLLCL